MITRVADKKGNKTIFPVISEAILFNLKNKSYSITICCSNTYNDLVIMAYGNATSRYSGSNLQQRNYKSLMQNNTKKR